MTLVLRSFSIRSLLGLMAFLSSLSTAALSAACPMCAAGSSDLAERYNASVTLLSYLPIAVTAVIGVLIYRSVGRR